MEARWGQTTLLVKEGDLTKEAVDAVVNAANSSLMGGGGVDGAIHRAGGPAILEECRKVIAKIGRLETGESVLTTGGNLPARYVIHTVGPVWRGGDQGEPELLASAYRNSLRVAVEHGLKSVAFPSISTGVYGYPIGSAARVALQAIREFCEGNPALDEVRLVLFGEAAYRVFQVALQETVERPASTD
jgi:O-acetyl-ADP-ribose deacetylase (regulator of RNase III)